MRNVLKVIATILIWSGVISTAIGLRFYFGRKESDQYLQAVMRYCKKEVEPHPASWWVKDGIVISEREI